MDKEKIIAENKALEKKAQNLEKSISGLKKLIQLLEQRQGGKIGR